MFACYWPLHQPLQMCIRDSFYTTNFDLSNHYEDNVRIVEKFDPNKIWTAALYDADQQNYPYLKRFCFEASKRKQNYFCLLYTSSYIKQNYLENYKKAHRTTLL